MRLLVVLVFIGIVFALGSAFVELLRNPKARDEKDMARSLTWRIGLSIALFVFLLIAYALGWVTPQGGPPSPG